MALKAWLRNAFRRRKAAGSFSEFAALIASPTDLGSQSAGGDAFTLIWPGNAQVAIASSGALTDGQVIIDSVGIKAGEADEIVKGPFVYENRILTIVTDAALAPCSLTIYALDEWKRPRIVATATVT